MEKIDTRRLPPSVQYELRKQVVGLKQAGRSWHEVSEITGLSPEHISRVWKIFQNGGAEAIKIKARGRRLGAKRVLSLEQEKALRKLMIDRVLDQFRCPFALWSRCAVQVVAERLFGVKLALRTISNYMNRWGFTSQKPMKLAYEQKPEAVKAWLTQSYPEIVKRAKEEKAEINWGDETGVSADEYTAKGYAPKERTPKLRLTGRPKKTRISLLSAMSNQGKVRFMMYKDKMVPQIFIKFMTGLVKDNQRKIFLIVDNRKIYHSRAVSKWLALPEIKAQIELFSAPVFAQIES